MIRHLKRGQSAAALAEAEGARDGRGILADIESAATPRCANTPQVRQVGSGRLPLTQAEIEARSRSCRPREIEDIRFAQQQIRNFAQIQRDSMKDVEVETLPGVVLGHRNIPVNAVGCYVPGGKYPLIASAHMSVLTAKVAGVPAHRRRAPPFQGAPHPAIVAAMHLAGADEIWCWAACRRWPRWPSAPSHRAGRHAGRPRQHVRGRGQAPAVRPRRHRPVRRPDRDAGDRRRHRRWRDVRDRPAGPGRARAHLAGRAADHLREAGRDTMAEVERQLAILPTAGIARQAWEDYGEVIVCDSDEEMLAEADDIASEHVQVMTRDPDWFLRT
jgi:sulfopropanediol 3-dehydrogenase